jgi:hypothetical protein
MDPHICGENYLLHVAPIVLGTDPTINQLQPIALPADISIYVLRVGRLTSTIALTGTAYGTFWQEGTPAG